MASIEVKQISSSCKTRMHVTVSVSLLACMRPVIRMHACDYDRSAAHGAQWQELELIFGWLLQHGNIQEKGKGSVVLLIPTERFMHACLRPMDAARFCEWKYANNHQLIVAGLAFKGFYDTHAQLTSVSYIHPKRRVRFVNTDWRIFCTWKQLHSCMSYTRMKSVLLRWTPLKMMVSN